MGPPLPADDHVARLCRRKVLDENGDPTYAAFLLTSPHTYLSVNWLERFGGAPRENQIAQLRAVYSTKFKSVGSQAKIVVLCVRDIRATDDRLEVAHEPEPNDPSHAGIHGIPFEDDLIAATLLEKVLETYKARGQE